MTSGAAAMAQSAVLATARRLRAEADAAEVGVLEQAIAWAALHEVADVDDAATWGDAPVPLAGEGSPLISEFCVYDFAAALGTSSDGGRSFLAHAIELAHRLPRILARVLGGELPVWRARRIAEVTITLSAEAAEHVDRQLAPYAHKSGPSVVDRLVDEAIARFMPLVAAERTAQAAERRHVTIHHDERFGGGTSCIEATLDFADAVDVEIALQTGAEALKAGGSADTLDVRRAAALGVLARGEDVLGLQQSAPRPMRELQLYVHLNADDPSIGTVENSGAHVVTREQVASWLGVEGTRVVVRPVIDLNDNLTCSGYSPRDALREQVILRDRTCVFPHCNRKARRADLDHILAYLSGGATESLNLAPLCRRHHRLKTHGRWTYSQLEPGTFLWRSPYGYTYLRDRYGTQDVTPRPLEPPGDS
ncbi:MAG: HNH endonuclease [Marmoricola sp.]